MAGFVDVSVIVAAYQAAGTVGRALASIAAQTVKPREVIVVDDGSTDGTTQAVKACAPAMPGIVLRVFRTEDNRGAGAARNRAVAESTQPILAFLDADDEWLPRKLERSVERLNEGGYVLVAHDYVTGPGDDAPRTHCERRFLEDGDPFVQLYCKGYIPSCSVVTRRDAVIAAGGFDEGLRNAQDFDLWLAMLRKPGARFLVFGEPLLRYHVTPGGIMSHTARRLKCGLTIAVRYFPDLRAHPGSVLASLWYRVAALHLEAIRAYDRRGERAKALLTLAKFPFRLAAATLDCLLAPPAPPDFRPAPAGGTVASSNGRVALGFALWFWLTAVMAGYLFQFRDLAGPVLARIGLG
jgi:glycosyltransferase involved in cell wall biosynthesis